MNDFADSPPLWVTLDNFSIQILSYALKNYVRNCLSISCQLMIEFLDNVAYQVKAGYVNELGNNLSLRREIFVVGQFPTLYCEFGYMLQGRLSIFSKE